MSKRDCPTAVAVRELRARTPYSQPAFAAYLHGIPHHTVRDWEQGARIPTDYMLAFIREKIDRDFPVEETE